MAEQKDKLAELKHWATLAHEQAEPKWSGIQGWIEDGGHAAMARTHETEDDEECDRADVDAEFIERASPDYVLKLLAVVEAAQYHRTHAGWTDGAAAAHRLDVALAALEGEKEVGTAEYWHDRFSTCLAVLELTQEQLAETSRRLEQAERCIAAADRMRDMGTCIHTADGRMYLTSEAKDYDTERAKFTSASGSESAKPPQLPQR